MERRTSREAQLRSTLLCVPLFVASFSSGQSGYQLAWDLSSIPDAGTISAQREVADGGQYVLLDGGFVCRVSFDGTPLWITDLGTPDGDTWNEAFEPVGSSGFLTTVLVSDNDVSESSVVIEQQLTRFDQNGLPIWSYQYRSELVDIMGDRASLQKSTIRTDHLGNIFLLDAFKGALYQRLWIRKLTADGTLLWVRSIDDGSGVGGFFSPDLDGSDALFLQVDEEGGVILGATENGPGDALYLTRLNETGIVSWSKVYRYDPDHADAVYSGISLTTQGEIFAVAHISLNNGEFNLCHRIDLDGVLLENNLYAPSIVQPRLSRRPGGNMLLTGRGASGALALPSTAMCLLEIDVEGDAVRAFENYSVQLGTQIANYAWSGASVADDRLTIAGSLDYLNMPDSSITGHLMTLSYSLSEAIEGCLLEPRTVRRTPVPAIFMITTDMEHQSFDMATFASISPTTREPLPLLPLPSTSDLCSLTVGIGTEHGTELDFTILGNPIAVGDRVGLQDVRAGVLLIYDATGALISEQRIGAFSKELSLSTEGLRSGVYLIRWVASDGLQQRAQRVVMQ